MVKFGDKNRGRRYGDLLYYLSIDIFNSSITYVFLATVTYGIYCSKRCGYQWIKKKEILFYLVVFLGVMAMVGVVLQHIHVQQY
jgi:hypothetical protein